MAGWKQLSVLCLFALVGESLVSGLSQVTQFEVKPNGQALQHSDSMGSAKCVFSWSAFGGTNEGWEMKLDSEKDGSYVCTARRPEKMSYLFFQSFKLAMPGMKLASAELNGKSGLLPRNEFVLSADSVKHKDGSFKNSLTSVKIVSQPSKTDL